MKDYSEVTLGELQDEYEDMLYPFICDGDYNGVTPDEIRSQKRTAHISTARQVSAYVIREVTQASMQAIGDELGNRDHSTIVYAIGQVESRMREDTHFKETVEDIVKNIRDS